MRSYCDGCHELVVMVFWVVARVLLGCSGVGDIQDNIQLFWLFLCVYSYLGGF